MRYADVKLVDSSGAETPYSYHSATGKWYPVIDNGLRGDRDYSIYAKQYSVDAEGKQNSFASDWFDTGVRFAPCTLGLSNTEPLVGDTVTATIPDNVPLEDIVGLYYKWYYVDDSGARAEITGETGDSLTIQPGSGYENCRLRVEAWFAKNKALGYAETAVIPAPEIIVKCDGEELEKYANGNYIAYLGDTITAEVANVSQTFLNGADDVIWQWVIGNDTIVSPSLELKKDRFGNTTFCDVSVALEKGTTVIQLSRQVRIYVAPAPDVTIDYENETLVVMKPENPLPEGYLLYVDIADGEILFTSDDVDKENTVPIASVKSGWPNNISRAVLVYWADGTDLLSKPQSIFALVTIPARPTVQQPTIAPAAFAISVEDVSLADYEMKLVAKGGAVTDESVGTCTEDASNGNVRFSGLDESTEYTLWMRKKATASAFRSAWKSFDVATGTALELAPSLNWTTGYDPKGFSLSAEDVLEHVRLTEKSSGNTVSIAEGDVTLSRVDGKPFPITEAGTYSLKLTLNGDLADSYYMITDAVSLTVQPYEVSAYDFAGRKTYKGAAYDPYDFTLKVEGRVLTKDDYTITVDNGAVLRNVGEYTVHIAFKGNYTGKLDGEVHLTIDPYTLRATASPKSRVYDGTVNVECSASWDKCAPFAGDDVTVKASGTMADASAGTGKTVAITLWLEGAQRGNYRLTSSSLTGSVTIAKEKAPDIDWPTAGDISYGQRLADSVLSHTRDANGRFAWENPEHVPAKATEWAFTMIYTPDDGVNYAYEESKLRKAVTIRVNRAAAPEIQWPSAGDISYGQRLADSVLTSSDLHGSFAWVNPNQWPNAGEHSFTVRYTPDDTENYDYSGVTLEKDVSVTVLPADAPVILWPTASDITYGDSLRASVLMSADTNGTFAWKYPDEKPNAGTPTAWWSTRPTIRAITTTARALQRWSRQSL
ncbi:MAG: YDG domain-containing protein [Clostridia bacterium]|nr:YDG domain-containing protein [Clostridia bacterium]